MPKYFEYDDPEMAKHVDNLIEQAIDLEESETWIKKDTTIYANNNRDKPFEMTRRDLEHRSALGISGGKNGFVVAKQSRVVFKCRGKKKREGYKSR